MRRKNFYWIGILLVASILISFAVYYQRMPGSRNAMRTIETFREGVNLNKPELIYDTLSLELRQSMTKEDFQQHFAKERSYPYLTPLYVNLETLVLSEDKKSGEIVFSVASRLPGQMMEANLLYQEDGYYIEAFEEIVDLSYLHKFDK